jgi:hypothetical protein
MGPARTRSSACSSRAGIRRPDAAARGATIRRLAALRGVEVAVHGGAVEGDDDDLAAVVGVGLDIHILVHVGHGEGHMGYVSVLEENVRALHLVPVVNCAIRVAERPTLA